MKIIVQGITVETTEIADIIDVEAHKKMFLNREAGFIIQRIDKDPLVFSERIPYDSYPSKISEVKSKWRKLQKQVYDKWQEDKAEIEVFKL